MVNFSHFRDSDGEGEASAGGCSMLTAATGDRTKNGKKDSTNAKRNYRKRRGGGGSGTFLGKGGTTETQTSVISSSAYETVDPGAGENGEVVYCSLQPTRLVQIDLTHTWTWGRLFTMMKRVIRFDVFSIKD